MNKHVTSLELSKKLKELGFPQESEFYWSVYDDGYTEKNPGVTQRDNCNLGFMEDLTSAYLASELGEMLPKQAHKNNTYLFQVLKIHKGYRAGYGPLYCDGKSMVEAMARVPIRLAEQGFLNPKELTNDQQD